MRWTGIVLAAWTAAAGVAAAGDMDLVNAIHVRVNGAPVMQQDVQETAELLVRSQMNGRAPTTREGIVELQAEAVRQQVRAHLILEDMRKHKIRIKKEDYESRLKRLKVNPSRVPPGVRRLVESQCVFPEVLMKNGVPRYEPPPERVREFYRRHAAALFREEGQIKLRRMLFYERPTQTRDMLRQEVSAELRRIRAIPSLAGRTAAVEELAREKSQDIFAEQGGLLIIDPEMEPGWSREDFGYVNPQTGERPLPSEALDALRVLTRAGAAGSLTDPVETELGLLVLYLEGIRKGSVPPFAEVKDQIDWILSEVGNDQRSTGWLRRKYAQSRITWNDGAPYSLEELLPKRPDPAGPR